MVPHFVALPGICAMPDTSQVLAPFPYPVIFREPPGLSVAHDW